MFDYRRIGTTEVRVTRVSFGSSSLGNLGKVVDPSEARAVLDCAWSAGIRYFDTAPHYGRGLSETRLGQFLSDKPRHSYTLSTKVGRVLTPGHQLEQADGFIRPAPNDVHYDYSAEGFERSLEGSRARLGVDYIDIVYVHDIGTYTHGANNDKHQAALLDSGLKYLSDLKANGRIGAYGLGVNENQVCIDVMRLCPLDVILLAGRWTFLDRSAEAVLVPLCRAAGTSIVVGGVFNSGILAVGAKPGAWFDYAPASQEVLSRVKELERVSTADGIELPHAALQFAMTRPEVTSVLIGTGRTLSLRRNLDMIAEPVSRAFAAANF